MNNDIDMQPKTALYRTLSLVGYFGLLAWVIIWHFALTNTEYSVTFILLLYVLPLVFPLYGIVKGKPYTHAWASFVVLLYLMHGITAWYSIPEQWLYALIEVIFSVIMFTGCSMYARLRGQELGHSLPKLKQVMEDEKQRFEGK
ncbi:MAG: DUF2069 domain-containing protein [Glaciecola sp.]|jgi:uncharacterized membrane protein|nr:DUF2069 domain-containing protein [Glaciecola sp.]MDG2099391.1 DUF2069 domain-containing protein [Glaciecola sp.]